MTESQALSHIPELDEASLTRVRQVSALNPGAHIHISGVCGTGTASVAQLLKQLGFVVTGSDQAFYPPMGEVIRQTLDVVYENFSAENLSSSPISGHDRPALVVIGNSLRRDNPEVLYTLSEKLSYASMPEVFAALLIGRRETCPVSIVVAGTHGKTTTTAAIATMLDRAGRAPGYFIGGIPNDLPNSVRPVNLNVPLAERAVVLEGDEYDSAFFAKWPKFHSYRPDIVVMTSLEFDHGDIYLNVEEIETEFLRLARRVPASGAILLAAHSARLQRLAAEWRQDSLVLAPLLTYGSEPGSDYYLTDRKLDLSAPTARQELSIQSHHGTGRLQTFLPGEYNAHNLLAAYAVGRLVGLTAESATSALGQFSGVKRRQQQIFSRAGIVILEDFAHHPTAVQVTLLGLRESYPQARLIAIYEPRSNTSRRAFFQTEYLHAFQPADMIYLREVQQGSSYSNTGEHAFLKVEELGTGLIAQGITTHVFSDVDALCSELVQKLRAGDVVVVMSNGDFGGLPQKLPQALAQSLG